ncbi:hypothetical protein [Cryobacterium aureum]|uniref:hypothetical protein n=1 Tax=Cryobacterium aureum TaxID=995037 RepID=UPI000CF4D6E7|nr:hypothetical protein [Cryobacterium aureum]
MAVELRKARAMGLSVAASDGDQSDEPDFVLTDSTRPRCGATNLVFQIWVLGGHTQFGAIPGEIYLARTAPRGRNAAARQAREGRAIEFGYPVDALPSVCRIAANAEVDT